MAVLSMGVMGPPSSPQLPKHRTPTPVPSMSRRPPYSRICRLPLWCQSQLSRAPIARFRASRLDYFKEEGDNGEPELLDPAACSGEVCSNGGLWCTLSSPWRWKYNSTSPGLPASPSSCCRRPPEAPVGLLHEPQARTRFACFKSGFGQHS